MKGGKTGLLSLALCTLIALLVVKLGLTVMDALHATPVVSVGIPAAMATEARPQTKPMSTRGPDSEAAAPSARGGQSMGALKQEENTIRIQRQQLKEEQKQLEKLKKEVQQKLNDLIAIQKQILLAQGQKKSVQNAQIQGLARIYGTMKPKQAAALMESLDDGLVKTIISTMSPDKAASILALMDVKKAAKISEALSGQN